MNTNENNLTWNETYQRHLSADELTELEANLKWFEPEPKLTDFELSAMLILEDEPMPDNEPLEKLPKRGRKSKKYREIKSASNALTARDATLSMKVKNTGHICKKDLYTFTNTFFPNKTQLPYSRIKPLLKLLACQFVLHNYHDNSLVSFPFVFRLSPEVRQLTNSYLKKKIQRKLQSTLKRNPLYWITKENDGGLDNTITHINGEILLLQEELEKCRQAFKELFGLHEIDAGGTIRAKPMLPYAIRFPLTSRLKEAAKYGEFYSVYNWPSYSTKQDSDRNREQFKNKLLKKPLAYNENFHSISSDLNDLATQFYNDTIKKLTL